MPILASAATVALVVALKVSPAPRVAVAVAADPTAPAAPAAVAATGNVATNDAASDTTLSVAGTSAASTAPVTTAPVTDLAALASLVREVRLASRPILLGSRDPTGPSCVTVVKAGELTDALINNRGDLDGGPGTSMATLYSIDRQGIKTVRGDYDWHQGRFRRYLENKRALNADAIPTAAALAQRTRALSELLDASPRVPDALRTTDFSDLRDWPSYCTSALTSAVAAGDLAVARRWGAELATAAASLEDLHRWLAFLLDNQLTAINFQADCEPLFTAADALVKDYEPRSTISRFPAGVLSLNGWGNYYEVERQAERLFSVPPDRLDALKFPFTPGSRHLPPGVRESYLKLQSVLSPANQKTWELAPQQPYERSYLVNMLFRASRAGAVDHLASVLQRLDRVYPNATVSELMSVMMYRGHAFAGLEWDDRFQPQLLEAANLIPQTASDADALIFAARWTNRIYRPDRYGVTFTLRDALAKQSLDCVRATDMIGAIFRNSGRTRFGNVRWCAETNAHSVAAYLGKKQDGEPTVIADGLMPPPQPEVWPDCYFHGHAWPPGLEPAGNPYCYELYLRGLDSYVWAEGYISRGPRAGTLTSAAVPYLPKRETTSSRKVFDGPYPQ